MRLEDRLALVGALRVLGFSVTMPFVGLELSSGFRVPLAMVSAFYAALAASGALGQLLGGLASDRLGRVKVMVLGALLASASLIMAAALYRALAVMVGVGAQGLFSNAYSVASMALVGDSFSSRPELVRAYGRLRVGSNAGWALGAALGGTLYYVLGFRDSLLVTAGIQAISLVPVISISEPRARGSEPLVEPPSRALVVFMIPSLLTFIIAGLMGYPLVQFVSGYLRESTAFTGVLLALNGVLVVALQDIIARRASALRPEVPLSTGMTIYALGYGLLIVIRSSWGLAADVVLITLGEMLVMPVSSALAALLSSPKSRGSHMGVYGIVTSTGRTLSSSVFALALSLAGTRGAWALESLVALSSSALYLALVPSLL